MRLRYLNIIAAFLISLLAPIEGAELTLEVEQITWGPKHHFFGYIGQCQTIPWNESGRYVLALRTDFHDRMPRPGEAADIVLIDTHDKYRVIALEQTRAWNFQQGTMFYWNPFSAETQFFFNDRDPETQRIFTVLYDIQEKKRLREYRFEDASIANGGLAPSGEFFAAINYGRMAHLRPVTGYPGARDWNRGHAPDDDGVFRVDTQSGQKRLLVSFQQLREALRSKHKRIDDLELYINHTLINRSSNMIYFFARGRLGKETMKANVPCTITADGRSLQIHQFIGGHPEWGEGSIVIGSKNNRQVLYDVAKYRIVGTLGNDRIFPKPEGDISLSPNGEWLVNGFRVDNKRADNAYSFFRLIDGAHARSTTLSRGPYRRGELRIDPAPRWNRTNDAVLVPGVTEDGTRQLHIVRVRSS